MAKLSRKWFVCGTVLIVAGAIAGYLMRGPVSSQYDDLFPHIVSGMRRDVVEALLGPPTGAISRYETARILMGRPFDDVDAPPVNLQVATAFWYDGRERRIRVEFVDDKVWRAKLNGPGMSRYSAQ